MVIELGSGDEIEVAFGFRSSGRVRLVLVSDFGRRRITCFGYVMRALSVSGQTKIWRQRWHHIVMSVNGQTLRYGASVGAILIVLAPTLAPY